jgi:DNA-directed RNA polymerase sigma subunit (sigma70/sigma32)
MSIRGAGDLGRYLRRTGGRLGRRISWEGEELAIVSNFDDPALRLRERLRSLHDDVLLTAGEELAAAATMADGRDAEYDLAALEDEPGPLDLNEAADLLERVHAGEAARDRLVRATRRLVISLARRHDPHGELTEELLSAGEEALARAADRYDPTGGLPFSSFARWWVERAMRQVDQRPPLGGDAPHSPADPEVLTALGHLHEADCRVIELRMGLVGGPPLSVDDTARVLGIDPPDQVEREERAVAKLRHPCTPGNLTHLRQL